MVLRGFGARSYGVGCKVRRLDANLVARQQGLQFFWVLNPSLNSMTVEDYEV